MAFHAGLDWGGTSHAVCVIDSAGKVVVLIEAHHDAAGLANMPARLECVASAAGLPIPIERRSGPIVDALVEAGHPVFPIHPNVVKACRPHYRAAGGKSGPGDACMPADIRALRALVRGRDDLVAQRVALANQLGALLDSVWPGAAAIFAAPTGLANDAEPDARGQLVRAPAGVREPLVCGIGKLVMSFPRAGRICAAQILAEMGDVRAHFPTEDQLAAEAGTCPVTHVSGKSRIVVCRWACNENLRLAITCFPDNWRHASAPAAAIYSRVRQRGCKHPHAVRILARACVRVLRKASQSGETYDPEQDTGPLEIAA